MSFVLSKCNKQFTDMEALFEFVTENYIMITVVVMTIIYRNKLIFEPLAGGNGKIQMDEIGKGVLIALLIYSVYVEANRTDMTTSVFSDSFYLILLSGVFAIASIRPVADILKHKYSGEEKKINSEQI